MIWIKNAFFCATTLSMAGSLAYGGVIFFQRCAKRDNYTLTSIWLKLIVCLYLVPVIYLVLFASNIRYIGGVWIKVGEMFTGTPQVISRIFGVVGLIWFIGLLVQMFPIVWEWYRIKKILAGNVPVESKIAQKVFDEYRTLSCFRKVELFANDMVPVPFTVGVFRPIVIIPYGEYSEKQTRIIIGHEMNHIQHRDMFWKQLCLVTKWIHWFNPLAHVLLRQMVFDMEVICDFRTILHNPFYTRKDYSRFLAEMCDDDFSNITMSALSESKNEVFRRIEIMAKQSALVRTKKIVAFLSCMVLTLVALFPTYLISAKAANMQSEMMKNVEDLQHDLDGTGFYVETYYVADDGVTEIVLSSNGVESCSGIYALDFTIPAKTRVLYKYQRMTTGQQVTTASNCTDSNVVYRIGIKNVNNWRALCIEGSGQMGHTFTVFENDLFTVFVENMMDYPFDIVGCYIYP